MVNANTNFDRVDANAVSMGRFGRPEKLADLVAFLASGKNGNITGTTILVDGGVVRSVL
jgi:3-oxoacyl-[acyl-carrier protein] reductase